MCEKSMVQDSQLYLLDTCSQNLRVTRIRQSNSLFAHPRLYLLAPSRNDITPNMESKPMDWSAGYDDSSPHRIRLVDEKMKGNNRLLMEDARFIGQNPRRGFE